MVPAAVLSPAAYPRLDTPAVIPTEGPTVTVPVHLGYAPLSEAPATPAVIPRRNPITDTIIEISNYQREWREQFVAGSNAEEAGTLSMADPLNLQGGAAGSAGSGNLAETRGERANRIIGTGLNDGQPGSMLDISHLQSEMFCHDREVLSATCAICM